MKFNFFFISYTVIYAKYNHCYEIPKDMPKRYFDGKEWKFMKTRHNVRTKALRYANISTELDWADLIKEITEIELQETTTPMLPTCGRTKTQTTTTKKATTKAITTKKTTTKRTMTKNTTTKKPTTKKITTKMTTPEITLEKDRPLTKIFTPTKASPRCKLKLKPTATTTIDPRIWQMKMLTSENWINAWTRVRPTKKLCPVGQDCLVDRCHRKLKLQTTTVDPLLWQKNSDYWINIWTRLRPTKKPPITTKKTTKKYTTKNLPATRTKKPVTTTKAPVTTTKKPVTTTKKPVTTMEKSVIKVSGIQGDDINGPEKWSNLMREFLKFVESKKCMQPPCEYGTTSTMPFTEYMLRDKGIRSVADDLTNFLMDGVQINDKLDNRSKVDDDASLVQFTETYEEDKEQKLNFDSVEDSASRDSKINHDNVKDLDLMSFKDLVKVRQIKQDKDTAQYRKKNEFLKELKSKNVNQNYETPRISLSEVYEDELKVKNAKEYDEVLQNSELNSYLDVFIDKHTKKENEPAKSSETKAHLDAENTRHIGKAQDIDIKKGFDAIKDMYTQTDKDNSQYVSKDTLNFKELNRITDYVATKRTYSTDSTEMRNDNDDFLQDRDITFDLGTLESDHDKADKYSTESIEFRESGVYAYADAEIGINEQKYDKTFKSYENVIPLFNFKYNLNDNITKLWKQR